MISRSIIKLRSSSTGERYLGNVITCGNKSEGPGDRVDGSEDPIGGAAVECGNASMVGKQSIENGNGIASK